MSRLQCDVCGQDMAVNLNEAGIAGRYGRSAVLCSLHHEAAREVLADAGTVSWRAMASATLDLNEERPSIRDSDEKWIAWNPLKRLIELYREEVARRPEDWPPFRKH
ncbi:MAG: hypothetical protein HYV63_00330 [Candidatus Schekmanbacteria bacterium]|nr:hypothetical protein [Candidatus Schekmanbacteria bacterium]